MCLALLLLVAVALFRPGNTGDVVASLETSPPPLPDVTVRQEFVTVSVPAVSTRSVATRNAGTRPRRSGAPAPAPATYRTAPVAASPVVRRAAAGAESFFDRARRAVVGDGRYRPQPFPRVKDDN